MAESMIVHVPLRAASSIGLHALTCALAQRCDQEPLARGEMTLSKDREDALSARVSGQHRGLLNASQRIFKRAREDSVQRPNLSARLLVATYKFNPIFHVHETKNEREKEKENSTTTVHHSIVYMHVYVHTS
jgi:hypothetical protein